MNFFQVLRRKIWRLLEKGEFSFEDVVALQLMQMQMTVFLTVTPIGDDIRLRRDIDAFALFLNKALSRVLTGLATENNNSEATES